MSEIINCFYHCIEDIGDGYKYSYIVPSNEGLTMKHLTTRYLETQPLITEVSCGRELKPQFEQIKQWFKQQINTNLV